MKDGYNGSGEIYKTFKQNGIIDIMDIFALTKDEIEELEYKGEEENFQLNLGQSEQIHALIAFNTNQIRTDVPLKIKY